jgi:peptidoglycan/xylan/chitin deacetylase (PgdA/CDA1 family)
MKLLRWIRRPIFKSDRWFAFLGWLCVGVIVSLLAVFPWQAALSTEPPTAPIDAPANPGDLPANPEPNPPAANPDVNPQTSPPGAATCNSSDRLATTNSATDLVQLVSFAVRPNVGIDSLISTLGPALTTQFSARPFPEIHEQARQARVPVIMYHDILPQKQVFFDVTPDEFAAALQLIHDNGLTPISLDQLVTHLSTGMPLPAKPIVLTFDDGYLGHYEYVYPMLKQYGYPATFAIYTAKVGKHLGRSSLNWDQLREMAADPLVTIASHTVTHPEDLGLLPDDRLRLEIVESKRILEEQLGIPIDHLVYPSGRYNERVEGWAQLAGYHSALTMNDEQNKFAEESKNLLSIERIGQSELSTVIAQAYGGPALSAWGGQFNFNAPIQVNRPTINNIPLILISGGKPMTIHANSRYQLPDILAGTKAIAAVDGGFFSLEYLDSNVMVGPVLSQVNGQFVPGNAGENPLLNGRPLVLIGPNAIKFVPFDAQRHNTLEGVQAEMPDVTDAFVAAAWLVKDGQPRSRESFGKLYGFDADRHRAFWGISQSGQPVIGVSTEPVNSMDLGQILVQAGFREAVMLDSGASTSLAYKGESLVAYTPRPVPHAVALVPSEAEVATTSPCTLVSQNRPAQ